MQPEQTPPQVYGPQQPAQPGDQPTPTQTPQPSVTPPQQNWQPSPTGNGNNKRKLLTILAIVVAVLIVGLFVIKPMLTKKSSTSSDTSFNSDLYYKRAGYDINKYGSSIGDPLALNMDKLAAAHNSPKGPIMYACNVVTIKDLNSNKLYLEPRNDDRAVFRNYVDSIGQASVSSDYTLTGGDDGNSCDYGLDVGGILEINVYQTPFITSDVLPHELERNYVKTDDIGGLSTYKDKDNAPNKRSKFMFVSGETGVEVLFNSEQVNDAQQKTILGVAAKNISSLLSTPQGPAIATYDTPTFKQKVARACDLITNDDIKAMTGSDASPYVYEGLASATGVYKFSDTLYNGIETSCARYNTGLGSPISGGQTFDHKLEVSVVSFNKDEAAKQFVAKSAADPTGVSGKVTARMGDEGFGYLDSVKQATVIFRKGRFAVKIVLDRTAQENTGLNDPAAMVSKLTPYGQQVATRLEAME